MLDKLTVLDFTPHIGAEFRLVVPGPDGASLPVRLAAATAIGTPAGPGVRAPFSLQFLGPVDPLMPQAIYRLESDALGPLEIFIVPTGRDASGVTYEAIFT